MDKDINEKNRSLYNKHANDATKDTQQVRAPVWHPE